MNDIKKVSSKENIHQLIGSISAEPQNKRITYRDHSILVTMPCWNEEGKVGLGVKAVPKKLVDTVVVVDNGSIDDTAIEAKDAGALVLSHSINLGAGGGIRSGLEYGRLNNYDLLAVLAGDNQDDPNDLYRAVDRLIDDKLDYVQGSRWLKDCLLYTSPSPRDATLSRMPSSA